MSIREVAKLAGVSMSTVSRVVNDHPSIAVETAHHVREAMAQLRFTPTIRRPSKIHVNHSTARETAIAFLVFGESGMQVAPTFQKLLRGVSDEAARMNLSLVFSFVGEGDELPPSIAAGQIKGLLLHGKRPPTALQARLRHLPTVWLMANRERSQWGDQVMPNNPVIGELAARYLRSRGHKHLACLKADNDGWSLRFRAWAFAQVSSELGTTACVLQAEEKVSTDLWEPRNLDETAESLVNQLLACQPRPTGIFVLEDRLLPIIHTALHARGLRTGPQGDIELVSCNNERPHHAFALGQVASVDLRAELIGLQGVKQLIWRMQNADRPERTTLLIEPVLVETASN